MSAPEIRCSAWGDGDYVVTVGGKAVGKCMSKGEAERARDWLISAWNEICDWFGETDGKPSDFKWHRSEDCICPEPHSGKCFVRGRP